MSENGIFEEVVLLDENNNEVKFDHVLTFMHEEEKYIALLPLEKVKNVADDEVVLLHVVEKNGEDVYENIENEVLLEEVFDKFLELMEELDEDE